MEREDGVDWGPVTDEELIEAVDATYSPETEIKKDVQTAAEESPYHCDFCGRLFKRKQHKKQHETIMHTHAFPYWCRKCPRGFFIPSRKEKHEKNCIGRRKTMSEVYQSLNERHAKKKAAK